MIKNFIIVVFIFFLIYFLCLCTCISNYIFEDIFEDYVKKVVINEDKNIIMLFKKNDSVSEMKTLDIIYHSEDEEKNKI
jgi:hypothetical protein